jgi:hypothetical protein
MHKLHNERPIYPCSGTISCRLGRLLHVGKAGQEGTFVVHRYGNNSSQPSSGRPPGLLDLSLRRVEAQLPISRCEIKLSSNRLSEKHLRNSLGGVL